MANLIPGANATESIAFAIPYKEEFFKLAVAENSSGRNPKVLETSRIEVSG